MVSSRSVAFVFLLVYIYGLYLTQSVHLHRLETGKLTDSVEFELVQCEANYIYDVRLLWDIIGRVWQWKKEATNSSQTQFKCLFFFVSRFLKSSFMVNHACSTPIMVQIPDPPSTIYQNRKCRWLQAQRPPVTKSWPNILGLPGGPGCDHSWWPWKGFLLCQGRTFHPVSVPSFDRRRLDVLFCFLMVALWCVFVWCVLFLYVFGQLSFR